jgi:bacterioferritin
MKGNRATNAELNKVLSAFLVAINQYFLHARILKNWGYRRLGKKAYDASIDAMKEADQLIERILFLEGLPNLQDLGKLSIGQTVPEILGADLKLEGSVREALRDAVTHCEQNSDFVSRRLLTELQEESEERIDFLETQQGLVQELGLANYLQSITGEIEED